jgi:MFS family permease
MSWIQDRRGPLVQSYPAAVALVVCALVPFLMLTATMIPLAPVVAKGVGLSRDSLQLAIAMSDAAYAFGTVLAVQFAQHLRQRRMLVLYLVVFVIASFLATWAPTGAVFFAAFVAQGICTSLMLIAAVPPLVTGWPVKRMPWTGGIMNLCIFGGVAAGPSIGALSAGEHSWRPLFAIVAAIACVALLLALLTFEDAPPQDLSAPWDVVAVTLAGGGVAAAFFGASELETRRAASALALVPLVVGGAAVALLVVHQFRHRRALMPVRQLATTLPLFGILIALSASASAFGLTELTLTVLQARDPGGTALLFLPEVGAAVVTAALFGALFRRRSIVFLPPAGLLILVAAAALLIPVAHAGALRVAVGTTLLGLGLGASVSPGLFIAGFSLRSAQIQRVFAMIELLRGVAAFLFAPIVLFLVALIGLSAGAWICLGIVSAAALASTLLYLLGGARPQEPDLPCWTDEGRPAWHSPPLLARLRDRPRER